MNVMPTQSYSLVIRRITCRGNPTASASDGSVWQRLACVPIGDRVLRPVARPIYCRAGHAVFVNPCHNSKFSHR